MKKASMFIQIAALIVFLLTSCGKDSNCKSEEIGEIPLSERADNYVAYPEGDVVYYVNESGEELTFEHKEDLTRGSHVNVEKTGVNNDLINGEEPCYTYYKTYHKYNLLNVSDRKYSMYTMMSNEIADINDMNERVTFRFKENGFDAVEGRYYFESDLFEDTTTRNAIKRKHAEIKLNEKTFTDVISASYKDAEVYLKEGEGIIAFKGSTGLWVIK